MQIAHFLPFTNHQMETKLVNNSQPIPAREKLECSVTRTLSIDRIVWRLYSSLDPKP